MDGQLLKDPNFLQIMLGTLGSALSAREPTSWQHQLGGAATRLGAGAKMATAMEKRRAEERKRWDKLFAALSGQEATPEVPKISSALSMMPTGFGGTSGMMPSGFGQPNIPLRYLGGF